MTGGPGGARNSALRRGPLDPTAAVLVRRIPVKVRNVSPVGCLLECEENVPVGMSGRLCLEVNGATFCDDIRVVRCQTYAGAARDCRIGVELLFTRDFTPASLRSASRQIMLGATLDMGGPVERRGERAESVVKSKRRTENHTARPPPDG